MTHEPMERDTDIYRALIDGGAAPLDDIDLMALRRQVGRAAASELRRRRQRYWGRRLAAPGALAAGLVLFAVMSRTPDQPHAPAITGDAGAGRATIDQVLDADVSDDQFRALLSGADETDELLLIAAQEQRQ